MAKSKSKKSTAVGDIRKSVAYVTGPEGGRRTYYTKNPTHPISEESSGFSHGESADRLTLGDLKRIMQDVVVHPGEYSRQDDKAVFFVSIGGISVSDRSPRVHVDWTVDVSEAHVQLPHNTRRIYFGATGYGLPKNVRMTLNTLKRALLVCEERNIPDTARVYKNSINSFSVELPDSMTSASIEYI